MNTKPMITPSPVSERTDPQPTHHLVPGVAPSALSLRDRLAIAAVGARTAWREDAGLRNQLLGAAAMLGALVIVQSALHWWGIALFASLTAVAFELMNSAIERTVDELAPGIRPSVKKLKDIAAAAVVVASLGVLVVGLMMIASEFAADLVGTSSADAEPEPSPAA